MTSPGPVLPPEVFDEIISQSTDETSTLKSCSLVCRSFRRRAQKILFHSIVVAFKSNFGSNPSEPINLVLIVEQAPHLIEFIQELQIFSISIYTPPNVGDATNLENALGVFFREGDSFPINLRSLWLHSLPWCRMSPGLKDAVVLLMIVHSLRDITLDHLTDCPPDLVQNLPPLLKHLSLTNFLRLPLSMNQKELPKLESLSITVDSLLRLIPGVLVQSPRYAVEHIVDLSQVKTFEATVCSIPLSVIEPILRQTSNSLENLQIQLGCVTCSFYVVLNPILQIDPDSIFIDLNQFPHLINITSSSFPTASLRSAISSFGSLN
ncbi:hypothetical protein M378DRAFT_162465 [Amanita muscaria Koide BX008]|uniref:Uncharacterized protein n=1 Tax=Amanita muscaria (strain Koide BX008) TaxID=946122 RepID=A0A0C2TED8_AMAMK|nr:hypothetical protein M378DRAFT_162465 [Amanita muscaria Koide BX008]